MSRIRNVISSIWETKFRKDDDYVDRLSRQYTIFILLCFALLVGITQYTVQPIDCWSPSNFSASQMKYANTICWISNTYYTPIRNVVLEENFLSNKSTAFFSFYRYVPLVLICMAMDMFIPRVVWLFLSIRSGIDISSIVDTVKSSTQGSFVEIREKAIYHIVSQIDRYLLTQRYHGTGPCAPVRRIVSMCCCLCCGRLHGHFLVAAYMIVKVLYLVMAVGEVYFIERFLNIDFHLPGLYITERFLKGWDWSPSERFPRDIFCEFELRYQSTVNNYLVQCALPINTYNALIFYFLWIWFVFVAFFTAIYCILWLFSILYWPWDVTYVSKHIRVLEATRNGTKTPRIFARSYLRKDGMFLLRLIEMNMGEAVAGEILCGLWKKYNPDRSAILEGAHIEDNIKGDILENV